MHLVGFHYKKSYSFFNISLSFIRHSISLFTCFSLFATSHSSSQDIKSHGRKIKWESLIIHPPTITLPFRLIRQCVFCQVDGVGGIMYIYIPACSLVSYFTCIRSLIELTLSPLLYHISIFYSYLHFPTPHVRSFSTISSSFLNRF